jgi:hypothetical protein
MVMEPILAESAPHRGRAVVFSVVLAVVASLALASSGLHRPRHHAHHYRMAHGKCMQGYVLVTR